MLQLDVARERKAGPMTWPSIELNCCMLYVVARYNIQHLPIDT